MAQGRDGGGDLVLGHVLVTIGLFISLFGATGRSTTRRVRGLPIAVTIELDRRRVVADFHFRPRRVVAAVAAFVGPIDWPVKIVKYILGIFRALGLPHTARFRPRWLGRLPERAAPSGFCKRGAAKHFATVEKPKPRRNAEETSAADTRHEADPHPSTTILCCCASTANLGQRQAYILRTTQEAVAGKTCHNIYCSVFKKCRVRDLALGGGGALSQVRRRCSAGARALVKRPGSTGTRTAQCAGLCYHPATDQASCARRLSARICAV